MKIIVIGCGYVGLATGTGFAEMGNEVVCVDKNIEKINMLNNGGMPLYEPGLQELVDRNMSNGRLKFVDKMTVDNVDIVICAVGTPTGKNGQTDLTDIFEVAYLVGKNINGDVVFVMKSTVPVGTTLQCKRIIQDEVFVRGKDFNVQVVSNPEFLRQGVAVKDTLTPDRIVVGVEDDKSKKIMKTLYGSLERIGKPLVFMSIESAELTKYAANAFLSMKISFINEMADLCDSNGANIREVAEGIGLDRRIGSRFLHAGIGYGGSCLGKDNKSLISQAKKFNKNLDILSAVELRNKKQKEIILNKLERHLGNLNGKVIGILGLSFKPKTDDLRNAPSRNIVEKLLNMGATIKVYDPISGDNFMQFYNSADLIKVSGMYDSAKEADALVVLTEWDEFRNPDFDKIKSLMKGTLLIDGRNIYDPALVKEVGLKYSGIGIN